MAIVGFNFTKIHVERKSAGSGKVNIGNNVSITDVKEEQLAFGKQKAYRIGYSFTSSYDPDMGLIELSGDVVYIPEEKLGKTDMMKEWEKKKALPDEATHEILNAALKRCCIEALILAREVNLPNPVPMPGIELNKKKND